MPPPPPAGAPAMIVSPLVERLGLQPHPEGGWYRRIWQAPVTVTPAGYPGPRPSATAIYFLLHPGEESRWHVVRSDELWLWHQGAPLVLRLAGTGPDPDHGPDPEHTAGGLVLGPAGSPHAAPVRLVPGGTWQSALAGAEPTLVSCVVSPGFDFADFRMSDPRADPT